jgi:GTPase involved in cell partitioning and DNA repair
VSQPTGVDRHGAEPARDNEHSASRRTSLHEPDTASVMTLANVGLVGVPLAYATSKSTLITVVAAILAIPRVRTRVPECAC